MPVVHHIDGDCNGQIVIGSVALEIVDKLLGAVDVIIDNRTELLFGLPCIADTFPQTASSTASHDCGCARGKTIVLPIRWPLASRIPLSMRVCDNSAIGCPC